MSSTKQQQQQQQQTNDCNSLRAKVISITTDLQSSPPKVLISAQILSNNNSQSQSSSSDERTTTNLQSANICLEGVWCQSKQALTPQSILHLIKPNYNPQTNTYSIDNAQGFLVTQPDNLLTCTYVASSLFCERKTWLNHVFLGQVGTNRAMLVGTLVHEVFQHAVKKKITQLDKLTKFLDELLDDATIMLEIYSIELHLKDVRNEAITYLPSVKQWLENYMLNDKTYPLTNDQDTEVKIIGIQDIEENVWSTKYGLKGKIDVTGAVRVLNKRDKTLVDKTIPLELKTGNPNLSTSHSAQVSLYSMMIEDRYAETNQGFVIYLKDKAAMHNITLTHNIKRDLIQRRNQINYSMKNYYFGPEMIDQPRLCKSCDRLTECLLMSHIYTPGQLEDYPSMRRLQPEAMGHLDQRFIKFFQKYHEKLIAILSNKQTSTSNNSSSTCSFWNYNSDQAEANGTGIGKLQVIIDKDSDMITFKRHPKHIYSPSKSSQQSNSETESKPVVKKLKISDYFNNNATKTTTTPTSKPFNTKLDFSRCRVAISVDQDDNSDMSSQNSTTAIAIGFINEIKEHEFTMKLYEGAFEPSKMYLMYRVDKIEKRVQADIERTVLVRLIAREDWRCNQIRDLILEPDFMPTKNIKLNHFVLTTGFDEISELEGEQQSFVVEAFSTNNYYILNEKMAIKRANVNRIITILTRIITTLDRNVLIVAQSIDNLLDLMKLLRMKKIKFILVDDGKTGKAARNQFSANLVKVPQIVGLDLEKKFDSYIRQHELAPVVITSYAMSIGGLLFVRKTFDYCVAYDCDKTELLISLSPLFCSDRYIIVDVRDENDDHNHESLNKLKKISSSGNNTNTNTNNCHNINDEQIKGDLMAPRDGSGDNYGSTTTNTTTTMNNSTTTTNTIDIDLKFNNDHRQETYNNEDISLGDHLRRLRSSI